MPDHVVPVRMREDLYDLVQDYVRRANVKNKGDRITMSSWIRMAIREKINHGLRSRKKTRGDGVKCHLCGLLLMENQVAYFEQLLTGKMEYTCKSCDTTRKRQNQTPLLDHGQTPASQNPADMG